MIHAATTSHLTRREILLLLMLAMVQFTHIMDFMIMMPLGPQLMRLFEISPRQFGFLVSAYTLTAGVSGFVSAFLVDRFDRKGALIFSYVGFTFGTLACAIAPTYELLMLTRSLAGAFGGVLGALVLAVVGDLITHEKRGRAMGIVMASFSLASVFGVPFGLYLANLISWHAPFVFVGIAAGINLILLLVYMPSMKKHMRTDRNHRGPVEIITLITSDQNQLKALSLTILLMLGQFVVIPFLSPAMVANVGFKESDLPWIYFVGGGLTIFTSPLVGKFADLYGKPLVFTVGASLSVIPVVIITNLGPTPVAAALITISFYFVFSNMRFIPAMAMITSTVHPATRGSFMSINSSVQSLAAGIASLLAGLIVASSPEGKLLNYEVVGYISVAFSILAIYIGRQLRPVDARPE